MTHFRPKSRDEYIILFSTENFVRFVKIKISLGDIARCKFCEFQQVLESLLYRQINKCVSDCPLKINCLWQVWMHLSLKVQCRKHTRLLTWSTNFVYRYRKTYQTDQKYDSMASNQHPFTVRRKNIVVDHLTVLRFGHITIVRFTNATLIFYHI